MSILYIRIFAIIKRHQAQRAIQRQQISKKSRMCSSSHTSPQLLQTQSKLLTSSSHFHTLKHLSTSVLNNTLNNCPTTSAVQCEYSNLNGIKELSSDELNNPVCNNINNYAINNRSLKQHFNATIVTSNSEEKLAPQTMLCRDCINLEDECDDNARQVDKTGFDCLMFICSIVRCSKYRLNLSRHSSSVSTRSSTSRSSSLYYRSNITPSQTNNHHHLAYQTKFNIVDLESNHHHRYSVNSNNQQTNSHQHHLINVRTSLNSFHRNSNSLRNYQLTSTTDINHNQHHNNNNINNSYEQTTSVGIGANKGHAKALVTTLLILGTYLLCWIPAVIFYALTCIDYCPFPITTLNYRLRIIISFMTNGLVILKAFVDPFIYTYRMKEMKLALNRYVRLPFYNNNKNNNGLNNNNMDTDIGVAVALQKPVQNASAVDL